MDLIGWRNLQDVRLRVGASPLATLALAVDAHFLALQQRHGIWSDAAGVPLDDPDFDLFFATSRTLGTEVDTTVVWTTPVPGLKASGGVSVFLPGPAAEERRGSHTSWWGFFALEATLEGSTAVPPEGV